jgi:hypothetical protein
MDGIEQALLRIKKKMYEFSGGILRICSFLCVCQYLNHGGKVPEGLNIGRTIGCRI